MAGLTLTLGACTEPGPRDLTGIRLAVGEATACALDPNGQAYCWGNNSNFFEFGESPATRSLSNRPVVVSVPLLASLSSGISQHMCGITDARAAICWGRGTFGELGRGTTVGPGHAAAPVLGPGDWAGITTGRITTCGWTRAGAGFCWGLNQRGELGDTVLAETDTVYAPRRVNGDITFASIAAGWTHTCGIATSGAAYCWGSNSHGQLGIGFADDDDHPRPLLVSFTQQFKSIALGARSTCAITAENRLFCWGYNGTGQLGDGTVTQRNEPTAIAPNLKFTAVSLGSGFASGTGPETIHPTGHPQGGIAHGCAIADTNQVYCWGWNGAGQLGTGGFVNTVVPTLVSSDRQFIAIAVGGAYSCGRTTTDIYCWGANFYGQVGNGSFVDVTTPVRVVTPW